MMDSNVHIDKASFGFPDPPKNSVDKGSSALTRPERHSASTPLQPRSAGFSYDSEVDKCNLLGESLEARRLSKRICEELIKGPATGPQDHKSPPERRKHSIKTVFSSHFKRKSWKENNRMPVVTYSTPYGKYGQILSGQLYDSGNASTYQVNQSRRPLASLASGSRRKQTKASLDNAGDATVATQEVNGTKEPVNECPAHSSIGNGEAQHRPSLYRTVGNPCPTSGNLGNRFLTEVVDGNTAAGRDEATLGSSSRKSTTEDSLGLLRDLSQILSGGDTTPLTVGTSRLPLSEAEDQPRIRDFAGNGAAPFSRTRAAVRCRSRSLVKGIAKPIGSPVMTDRSLNAATYGGHLANRLGASTEPARPSLAPSGPMNQEHVLGTRTPPVIKYHSKEPSVVSAESMAEDIQSDASSGVVSNAQSAIFVKIPPRPGPAPLMPLPSLPEGVDNLAPATPGASQSSRRLGSPESSASKPPPQGSPAGSQYKLYPSVDSSPLKKPGSPVRVDSATESEQLMTRPSPPFRSKRHGFSFSRAECLPTSMSVGTLDELEQWKKERAEKTREKKILDLARMRCHKAMVARVDQDADRYHEAVAELPDPMDSYSSAFSQASSTSKRSASTTLKHHNSSRPSQKLSPIIVVAEQEPISPVQRARGSMTNGFHPEPPHSATLQQTGNESEARPVSSYSLPVPPPVASVVATTDLSPLLRRPSHRSSHRSSIHRMSGLEARLSAIERKNAMLERAFLAVLDTSATFSDSRTGGNASRDGDCSSRTSATESLYARLENLIALHDGSDP